MKRLGELEWKVIIISTVCGVAERGCYCSDLFCYSGHLDFLARLKGGAIFCYFGVVSHTIMGIKVFIENLKKEEKKKSHNAITTLRCATPRYHSVNQLNGFNWNTKDATLCLKQTE